MEIFGLAISATIAAVFLIVGVLGLTKGSIGQAIKGMFSAIPIGNPKLWAVIFVALGLIAGGIGGTVSLFKSATGSISTGSLTSSEVEQSVQTGVNMDCRIASVTATTAAVVGNVSMVSDVSDLKHYTIALTNSTNAGAGSVNGTIICTRAGSIDRAASAKCEFKAGSFRNRGSTSDTATYYMVDTSASASYVSGFPYLQTAYLKSGGVAASTDTQEKIDLIFAGGGSTTPQAQQTLGFNFKLPSATQLGYLNDQDSVDNGIYCDTTGSGTADTLVARLTVTKVAE